MCIRDKSQRIVVALGGNALGKNLTEQYHAVRETAKVIVDLIADGNQVVIAHGNGPQVGMIQSAMTELTKMDPVKYPLCPLPVCVAMSQGYICLLYTSWISRMTPPGRRRDGRWRCTGPGRFRC